MFLDLQFRLLTSHQFCNRNSETIAEFQYTLPVSVALHWADKICQLRDRHSIFRKYSFSKAWWWALLQYAIYGFRQVIFLQYSSADFMQASVALVRARWEGSLKCSLADCGWPPPLGSTSSSSPRTPEPGAGTSWEGFHSCPPAALCSVHNAFFNLTRLQHACQELPDSVAGRSAEGADACAWADKLWRTFQKLYVEC